MNKTQKTFYSLVQFQRDVDLLAQRIRLDQIKRDPPLRRVFGIPKGGVPVAMALSAATGLALASERPDEDSAAETLVVDDLVDSGHTLDAYAGCTTATLHSKAWTPQGSRPTYCANPDSQDWIVYWWEGTEEKSAEDAVLRQLQFIGEDPMREGLLETPARVVRAWGEQFAGYKRDPLAILKSFEDGACDEMVVLRDIELYSTCEHHLLPFYGRAHIGYVPDKRVVGVSKLARLVDVFARRAQIQERIGQQVTQALMDGLQPKGAACVIEARHLCMMCRGVGKQNSVMTTSSLRGVFLERPEVRAEFMGLIRG